MIGWDLARADEIHLRDGTKINGTIVAFENDSFKVETAYGFALIRKDKVADIIIPAPKKESESKAKTDTAVTLPAAAPPAKNEAPPVKPAVAAPVPTPPPVASEPPVIRDEIRGNLYVNLTYGFQIYKPPSWELMPAARKALSGAVAALGTGDQTTLLVIGRESAKGSVEAYAAGTAKVVSEVYENYRLISSRHVMIAGLPAIEQRSRGTADGHDWSVVLVTFLHGNDAFTLLGMSWANSDLIQVQENVIEKVVNSLTFAAQ